jgi:ribonuclease HII
LLRFERQAWADGNKRLAGVDEAGRGPLAGPVVAAAVVFEREFLESEECGVLSGLDDSKKLSENRREEFHSLLFRCPRVSIGVGLATAVEIDRANILAATHAAMQRAVAQLSPPPDHVLVDGLPIPGLTVESTAIVRGDSRSLSVAAASIVAKVTRDRIMRELDRRYPGYGFARHKGYGTKAHMRALLDYGPCPVHRYSFQPVSDAEDIARRSRGEKPGNATQ